MRKKGRKVKKEMPSKMRHHVCTLEEQYSGEETKFWLEMDKWSISFRKILPAHFFSSSLSALCRLSGNSTHVTGANGRHIAISFPFQLSLSLSLSSSLSLSLPFFSCQSDFDFERIEQLIMRIWPAALPTKVKPKFQTVCGSCHKAP